jgi:hypothetical protein
MAQNMEDVTNTMQFVQMAAQLGPEGQATPKYGEIIDFIGDKLGVPTKLRASAEERRFNMEQMAQQAQQLAQQNPEMLDGADTDKKILDMLGVNNIAEVLPNA